MKLLTVDGQEVDLKDEVFAVEFNGALVHQVAVAYLSGGRQGSKSQKNRSDVRGGGKKPWRQKGSGRARAGTSRSPIWTGGGVTFAADNDRNYKKKVNKKAFKKAFSCVLSEAVRQERLKVVDQLACEEISTKKLKAQLSEKGMHTGLVIVANMTEQLWCSGRNLANVTLKTAANVDLVTLISAEGVLATKDALEILENRVIANG